MLSQRLFYKLMTIVKEPAKSRDSWETRGHESQIIEQIIQQDSIPVVKPMVMVELEPIVASECRNSNGPEPCARVRL